MTSRADPRNAQDFGRAHSLLLWVQFDGSAFSGFQRQQGEIRSVAGTLEHTGLDLFSEEIWARSSSRTDAGVHARRMPVLVRTNRNVGPRGAMLALNTRLPDDLKVTEAEEVAQDADIRADAVGKRYLYHVLEGPVRLPLWRLRAWHVRGPLDLAKMQEGAAVLRGVHDFSAFRSQHCGSATTLRDLHVVSVAEVIREGEGRVLQIAVDGNAFLHNMVRIIAGTLVDLGRNRRQLADLQRALGQGDRRASGQTAPPHGLQLDDVYFGPWGQRLGTDYKSILLHMDADRAARAALAIDPGLTVADGDASAAC